ncbi:MAG: hypothetical protein MI806_22540 [Minwuiales bacterium]|nr:hypothetical protein [Minwuiales bacterium]
MPVIPFAEWLPDLPSLNNPGATEAKNVIPGLNSYRPLSGLNSQDAGLDNYARGAFSARGSTGLTFNYAGDAGKLYRLSNSAATDQSKLGGYSLDDGENWEFAVFGDKLIATSIATRPQVVTLGGTQFADLAGNPPQARHVCTLGKQDSFLVLANVNDVGGDGLVPNRVQWSAAGDETGWVSGTDLAGQQDLQGNGGWIRRVCGGEFGVIWQEHSIWRMDFVGAPDVFSFAEVEEGRGTPSPGSVTRIGNTFFYLGWDGFYAFDGVKSVPIGANKVNARFYNEVDQSRFDRISSAVDPVQNIVVWAYPTGDSKGNADPDKLLLYDINNDRWSRAEVDLELIYAALSDSITLDDLDTLFASIDDVTPSLDSRQWVGNALLLAAFDRGHKRAFFNGATLPATLETGEVNANPGGTAHVSSVRPLVDGASHSAVSVQVGTRQRQSETVSFSPNLLLNEIGEADFRRDARYHRFRTVIAGGENWTHAVGVDPVIRPSGKR